MTTAHCPYSATAKNVIYVMIDALQKWQTHEKEPQRNLFGEIEIELDITKIAKSNNYNDVWNAIEKELMTRPTKYTYRDENAKMVEVKTVLVPTMRRVRGETKITMTLVSASIPVLLFLGQGFTAYSRKVAITLPSAYSKKLYELCCRFRDSGFYHTTIVEFRQLMNCENKLKQIVQLRDRVIEQAIKDINELSELHVSYLFFKGKRCGKTPAKIEQVKFFIAEKITDRKYYFDDYRTVYSVLESIYDSSIALGIADWFMDNKRIVAASERLAEVQRDTADGVIKKHGAHNYLLAVLEGFGVPSVLLPPLTAKKAAKSAHKKKIN
jgi:plasmid replication initiation protein